MRGLWMDKPVDYPNTVSQSPSKWADYQSNRCHTSSLQCAQLSHKNPTEEKQEPAGARKGFPKSYGSAGAPLPALAFFFASSAFAAFFRALACFLSFPFLNFFFSICAGVRAPALPCAPT